MDQILLIGVIETAQQATETAQSIVALFLKDRAAIANSGKSTAAIFIDTWIFTTTPNCKYNAHQREHEAFFTDNLA